MTMNDMNGKKINTGTMTGKGNKHGNIDTFMPGATHSRPIKAPSKNG